MNQNRSRRGRSFKGTRLVPVVALLAAGGTAFVYGLLVGKYEVFPYAYIQQVYRAVLTVDDADPVTRVRALHTVLEQQVVTPDAPLVGYGGGISRFGDIVVGVDSGGHFFYYVDGRINPLAIEANLNREAAIEYIDLHMPEELKREAFGNFRVFDLELRRSGNSAELYMTHHYWDEEQSARLSRVSRLVVQDLPALIDNSTNYGAKDWEVVYECQPAIQFTSQYPSPFISNHANGRLAIGPDGGVYVSFGDAKFDGVTDPFIASQEDETCFGKIFHIDPTSLQAREVARGLRNPQGLMFDADSQLWSTDHGPHGGDELNVIENGANYGWPYNTHGTSYDGRRDWPLAIEPGRHEEFSPPVYSWLPSVGASAILQVGEQPAVWRGDFLMGSLKGGALHRMRIRDRRVVFEERVTIGERIRDLVQLDDGRFILWTDTPHLLVLQPTIKSAGLDLPVPLTDKEKESEIGAALVACAACHALGPDEVSPVAPSLWRVHGRPIGSTDFPGYSLALRKMDGDWNDDALARFLAAPQNFANGTTMRTPLPMSEETRKLVIGYLKRLQ